MSIDRRILIADDDVEVRTGAAELLDALGLIVREAGTGSEALSILRRETIHVALLDMHMPDRTGLDVFQALRAETREVPCILWSGDATEEVERFVLRAGARGFLHKPVPPERLREEIRRVLEASWGSLN